jgi:hypothetical protein
VLSSRKCNFNQKENPCNQLEDSIRGDIGCINLSDIKNGCRTSKSQKSFYDMYKKSIKTCTDYKVQYQISRYERLFYEAFYYSLNQLYDNNFKADDLWNKSLVNLNDLITKCESGIKSDYTEGQSVSVDSTESTGAESTGAEALEELSTSPVFPVREEQMRPVLNFVEKKREEYIKERKKDCIEKAKNKKMQQEQEERIKGEILKKAQKCGFRNIEDYKKFFQTYIGRPCTKRYNDSDKDKWEIVTKDGINYYYQNKEDENDKVNVEMQKKEDCEEGYSEYIDNTLNSITPEQRQFIEKEFQDRCQSNFKNTENRRGWSEYRRGKCIGEFPTAGGLRRNKSLKKNNKTKIRNRKNKISVKKRIRKNKSKKINKKK